LIYLDTHVVVWLYTGEVEKLNETVIKLINENEIYISTVVRLELQYLFEIKRLKDESNEIVFDLSNRIGLKICDKNFNSVISKALEQSWTRDPFDRIIVANAALNENILISKDKNVLDNYEKAIW